MQYANATCCTAKAKQTNAPSAPIELVGASSALSVLCRPQILNPFLVWAQEQAVRAAWPPLVAKWFDLLAAMAGDEPSASAIFNSMLLATGQPESDRLTWPAVLSMIQQVQPD